MRLARLSSSRLLWLARSAPCPIRYGYSSYSSWSRRSGYLALTSLRLPFLWLLIVRYMPTSRRLAELRIPLP